MLTHLLSSYTSVGGDGSYNKVTNMDPTSGTCSSSPYGYSGNLSPMNEEISIHIRGPTILKRFAAYTPGSASSKKKRSEPEHRHAHGHMHDHLHKHKRNVGDMAYATIDGILQSWTNQYDGGASSPATSAPAAPAYSAPAAPAGDSSPSSGSSSGSSDTSDSPDNVINPGGPGSWGRHAYYSGDDGTNEGLVFLNHNGGSGSGTFDYKFGNSLSYASSDGRSGAGSAQTLAKDTLLPSSAELVIMTDDKCDGDDCGYYRPETSDVAYHGFDGDDKAFFFEFQMPDSGESSDNIYDPVNMPAIWSLNAQIPRTLQYGEESCSCWSSGCGEFDIFEVLKAGDARMKSTMHGNKAGGSSDYFYRPFNEAVKGAMIMMNDQIHVKMLPNDTSFDFPETMDKADLNSILTGADTNGLGKALFSLASAASG